MTTSISSVSAGGYTATYQPAQPKNDPMMKVAETLGLSSAELKDELGTGKTLNDIATERGVSHDDLIAAIEQGLPATAAAGAAEKIASSDGATPPPPPPPPPAAPAGRGENSGLQDKEKLQQVSDLLDMDTKDVTEQATSAAGLIGLMQNRGVDLTQLRSVLSSGDILDVKA
ncbi:hypothetical protein [Actinoplanes sp. NBRC 101535]|uniref:hypothetical protein n=2 Tax=Actinoplanes TaxID=1865 RepID=UPI0025544B48|nr:hypothetical protein [Actinoplanes sp. NBRC 101535]